MIADAEEKGLIQPGKVCPLLISSVLRFYWPRSV